MARAETPNAMICGDFPWPWSDLQPSSFSDERALPDLLFELYEPPGAKPGHNKSVTGAALTRAAMAYEKQTVVECLHAMAAAGYAYAVVGGVQSPELCARTGCDRDPRFRLGNPSRSA